METTGESVSVQSGRGSLGTYHLSWNSQEVKEPPGAGQGEACEDRVQAGESLLG